MKKLLYIILFVILAWFAGLVKFNDKINHFKTDDSTVTDAIVVLTGGRNRLAAAVDLLNEGRAEKLFISGVFEGTSMEELQRREDVEIINSQEITLDKKSQNTIENAIETARWIEENDIKSIRLVTSNYHLPRSMIEFRTYNPVLQIVPHAVFSDRISKDWWGSWQTFFLVATEYNKFIYVRMRELFTGKGED